MIGVIFDCDGTLVDSMGAWHEVDRRLAEDAGIVLSAEDTDRITTMSLPECSAYLHEQCGLGKSVEDVDRLIFERMLDFYTHEVKARPGALAFVEGLAARGVPMAVASSTPPVLLRTAMERCGFAPYMRAVLSVEEVGASKREPVVYERARSFLGTDRAFTWGFEDATYAVRTLVGAGFRTVGIYNDDISGTRSDLRLAADLYIESFEELPPDTFLAQTAAR